ncbi:MAG: hypothetical protein EA427_15940 [Spirochaetaceae bacterium]|nr:MAG: hypothetical protein EA427_15940 [Spirochaetaceae bacterium]
MATRRLRELFALVHDEDIDPSELREVHRELGRMRERFVLPPEFYPLLVSVINRLGLEGATVLADVEEGVRKYPEEPILLQILGMMYTETGYPLLGRELLNQVLEIAPRESRHKEGWYDEEFIRHVVEDVEESMPELLRETNLSWPADEEAACAAERVRRRTETGRFEESLDIARALLEQRPDQNSARNNLARALWELGQWEEAVEQQAESLRRDPNRLVGLSNMVRFCLLADREEEAYRWRDHASTVVVKDPADRFSRLEIAALCRDDQEVLRLAEQFGRAEDFHGTGIYGPAMVLYGAGCARTGDSSGARRWWNRAARFDNARASAEIHLEEFDRPGDDRNDPWYFGFLELMPNRVIRWITAGRRPPGTDQEYIRELLDAYPQIAASARYHLRTGDDMGRYFGLIMAEHTGAEWLAAEAARLVTGNVLRKDRKSQAMRFLADHGEMVLEEETPEGSNTQTVRVHEFEISREPTGETPPEVEALATEAHWLLREGDGAGAERLLRKALKTRDDHPAIWQNLAVAYEMQGKDEKAWKILKQTHERFPDYAFARYAVAVRLAREEGKVKEAFELLQPIMEQRKYHVSEFTALCHAMVLIHMADKKFDAALQWLDMWKDVEPDDPRLEDLTILDGYRAVRELTRSSRKPKTRKPATPEPPGEDGEGQLSLF